MECKSNNQLNTKIKVVSYDNDKFNKHKQKLEKKLKYYDYSYVFLGEGEKWKGFGTKSNSYQEYIKNSDLNDEDILIIIDSRDVYVNRPSTDLLEEFESFYKKNGGDMDENLKIVFSSEIACCTPGLNDNNKKQMKEIALKRNPGMKTENGSYYLNAGMCIGYVKAYKKIYSNFIMNKEDDDQTEITKYWLTNYLDNIILDYNHYFLSNAHVWGNNDNLNGCKYIKNGDTFVIENTNVSPFFIQTPAKYWKCYRYLYGNPSFFDNYNLYLYFVPLLIFIVLFIFSIINK